MLSKGIFLYNKNINIYKINQPSIALIDQVRSIDVSRIVGYLGTLKTEEYAPIRQGLKHLLKL